MEQPESLSTRIQDVVNGVAPSTPPPDTSAIVASPWLLFGGVFLMASLGGLAALLRGGSDVTVRQVISALLNSGLLGLIIALVLWQRYGGEDPYLLIGLSVFAGFGGATTIDLLFQLARKKLGLSPNNPSQNHDDNDDKGQ